MPVRHAHPRIAEAFLPLVEHFAYAFDVERHEDRVARIGEFRRHAGAALLGLLDRAGAGHVEVQLLDLHGMRAKEAKAALPTCTEPIAVVWFGKGRGELREIFLEFLEDHPELRLVDLSGETRARPQEAMGVVVTERLHEQLMRALDPRHRPEAEVAPRDPREVLPTPSPPWAAALWAMLVAVLNWLLRRRR